MDPSPAELLAVWERCLPLSPAGRAVALVELAAPDLPPEAIQALPVGARDRWLLDLRTAAFGGSFRGLAACPSCGRTTELSVDAAALTEVAAAPEQADLTVDRDGYHIGFRLPTAGDLLALDAGLDAEERGAALLARCLRWAERNGSPVAAAELPDVVVDEVEDAMSRQDPLAEIELACECADCGRRWNAPLDVATWLWTELEDHATRLLREVHELASGYGWREVDILALSPVRRRAYLDLVSR